MRSGGIKRFFVTLLVGAVLGGIVGFGGGIFLYPYWFLDDVATETLAPNELRAPIARGTFSYIDPIHWGQGGVSLYREGPDQTLVHLESDFEVGPGPRFHVYLVDSEDLLTDEGFVAAEKVDLGRLRAFMGSQVYPVPPGIDAARFKTIAIWCKEFEVLISPAELIPVAAPAADPTNETPEG
jgi:hypothetical protein